MRRVGFGHGAPKLHWRMGRGARAVEVEELVHHRQLPLAGGTLPAQVARLDGAEVLGLL